MCSERREDGPRVGPSPAARRLVRVGLAAALISRVFGRLVGSVLVIVLAHYADPTTVAVYGYLLGTLSLVIGLTSVGVASIGAREVAAGRIPVSGALRAALGPHCAALAVAAILTVVLTLTLGPDGVPPSALVLTVGCVLAGGLNGLYAEMLRGSGRVVLEGVLQMAAAIALVAAGSFVVLHGTPLNPATALLAAVLIKEVALLLVGMALLRPKGTGVGARDLLRQSVWMGVASTAFVGLWRHGMVVIGAFGDVDAVATYVVASRYQDAGVALAFTAGVGLRPGFAALSGDPDGFRHTVRHYLGVAAGIGVVTAVVGALAGQSLVSVPFGPRWTAAVVPVQVIAGVAAPILVMSVALGALVSRGALRRVAVGAIAGATVGTAVSVVLTHWHPTALSPTFGTAVGVTVIAAVYLVGLRDLLQPVSASLARPRVHR